MLSEDNYFIKTTYYTTDTLMTLCYFTKINYKITFWKMCVKNLYHKLQFSSEMDVEMKINYSIWM